MPTTSIQVLDDGPRNYVVHLTGYVGGGDAETLATKVNISQLSENNRYDIPRRLTLIQERFSTYNIDVQLYWEGTPNELLSVYPANRSDTINHERYGGSGIIDDTTAATGNVLLSVENYNDPPIDGKYAITLWFKKEYA
jgi:hypothetical protein